MGPGPAPRRARRPQCRTPAVLPHLAAPLGRRHGWIAPILCAIPPTSPLAARRTVGSLKRSPFERPGLPARRQSRPFVAPRDRDRRLGGAGAPVRPVSAAVVRRRRRERPTRRRGRLMAERRNGGTDCVSTQPAPPRGFTFPYG